MPRSALGPRCYLQPKNPNPAAIHYVPNIYHVYWETSRLGGYLYSEVPFHYCNSHKPCFISTSFIALPTKLYQKRTMTFDIYFLDQCDDDWHEALEAYTEDLIELFVDSPEGLAHFEKYQDVGGWSSQFVRLGFIYQEVTLPEMDDSDVESILLNIFPRKISLMSPDDIKDTIPELIAFWKYLQREYDLAMADEILDFLQGLSLKKFQNEMNNPANFGMAKSFFQSGINAGFDILSMKRHKHFSSYIMLVSELIHQYLYPFQMKQ